MARMGQDIEEAALCTDNALFTEYWGSSVPAENSIKEWLKRTDVFASGNWKPSKELFSHLNL